MWIGRWLGNVEGRQFFYFGQLRLETEDVAIFVLVFAIFVVRQTDIINRSVHATNFSILLLRYGAGLGLLLAIGTL